MLREFIAKKTATPSTAAESYFALYVGNSLKQLSGQLRREAEDRILKILHEMEDKAERQGSTQKVTHQQQNAQCQPQSQASFWLFCEIWNLKTIINFAILHQYTFLFSPNIVCYRSIRTGSRIQVNGQHSSRDALPVSGSHKTDNGCRVSYLSRGVTTLLQWAAPLWLMRQNLNHTHQVPTARRTRSYCREASHMSVPSPHPSGYRSQHQLLLEMILSGSQASTCHLWHETQTSQGNVCRTTSEKLLLYPFHSDTDTDMIPFSGKACRCYCASN